MIMRMFPKSLNKSHGASARGPSGAIEYAIIQTSLHALREQGRIRRKYSVYEKCLLPCQNSVVCPKQVVACPSLSRSVCNTDRDEAVQSMIPRLLGFDFTSWGIRHLYGEKWILK